MSVAIVPHYTVVSSKRRHEDEPIEVLGKMIKLEVDEFEVIPEPDFDELMGINLSHDAAVCEEDGNEEGVQVDPLLLVEHCETHQHYCYCYEDGEYDVTSTVKEVNEEDGEIDMTK
ncbi:unnamed protein product [Bursaphelenchus xylophilus]|uniref:(pine wood nematode) hypothetical protein n=1 Tax=Bursaphelenchus xylophilus TaxID=6326 RepID=A0A1I7SL00_BURXY|nr:unnamed protein product [Bursaphelenchus xylophilus]CAG9129315.1 unnamed protein product [Bursaphelenchus xylophilus]